ncbi:MAG: antibiotic biosynthesis monooxygenase [Oceanospirillaceae bacterium]|nr:antibiotic biosynthesis monooxygenase [Oceanospirillaceae bacterium]
MDTFLVSAGLKTCAGKSSSDTLAKLAKLQAQTIKEPGCMRFDLLQHRDNPTLFTLWEEWHSEQDLQAHFKAAHTLEYLALEQTEVLYVEKLVRINGA